MLWHELKSNARRENVHTKDTDEVMNLIRKTFDKIDSSHWNKYIEHVKKVGYWKRDHIVDEHLTPVIITLNESDSEDECLDEFED